MFKTVAGRLMAGFGVNIVILAVAVAAAFFGISSLNEKIERMATNDWVKAHTANQIANLAGDISILLESILINPESMAEKKQKIQAKREEIRQQLEALDKLLYLPKGRELFGAIQAARKEFVATSSKMIELLETGHRDEALSLFNKTAMPQLETYKQKLDDFVRLQNQLFEEGAEAAKATHRDVVLLLGAVLLGAIVFSGVVAGSIVRSVVKPLGGEPDVAKSAVAAIARGDLSQAIPLKSGDKDSLLAELEQMRRQLGGMLGGFQRTATELNGSAESLAQVSQQVAASSASQSDSSESMAAAIEELTTSIAHVSASAGDARRLGAESGGQARAGKGIMEDTARKMESIAEEVRLAAGSIEAMGQNSQQITSVVQVIREVADQTNLLALNAAIEAARAGEQGRGFAVVADEVRKLAERTSTATTEIAAMIDSVQADSRAATDSMSRIVNRVKEGVDSAQKASGTMSEIAASAETVVNAVSEISYALEEQTAASQQLARNVEDVAHMSEQNSQATRAAANTALDLGAAADSLHETVKVFRI